MTATRTRSLAAAQLCEAAAVEAETKHMNIPQANPDNPGGD